MGAHAVQRLGCFVTQGHSSTVEYRSPKPRMRVRFLLPLPLIVVVFFIKVDVFYEEDTGIY